MSEVKGFVEPAELEGGKSLRLSIQEHIIAQPLSILGVRNAGKSYMVGKILELLSEAGQPFIVIDHEGEYWTLREQYPVLVAAMGKTYGRPEGYKADITFSASNAGALARRVVEKGYSIILDLKNATMADAYGALANFLEALQDAESHHSRPIILVMEEGQLLVPEVGRVRLKELKKLQEKVIYWTYEIVAGGRHRGLGFIIVARRAAEVAKAVLSQCPVRIIFRMVDPADFSWLRESGLTAEQIQRVKMLPQGSALAIGVYGEPVFIKVRRRKCTHGGSTPINELLDELPETTQAAKDLAGIMNMASAAVTGVNEARVPIKELRKRTEELLESARKALQNVK